jgi:hypothetical protein
MSEQEQKCSVCGIDLRNDYCFEDNYLKKIYCVDCFKEEVLEQEEKQPIVNQ